MRIYGPDELSLAHRHVHRHVRDQFQYRAQVGSNEGWYLKTRRSTQALGRIHRALLCGPFFSPATFFLFAMLTRRQCVRPGVVKGRLGPHILSE